MSKEINVGMGMDEIIVADRLRINDGISNGTTTHGRRDRLHRQTRNELARERRRDKFWEQFSIAHRN